MVSVQSSNIAAIDFAQYEGAEVGTLTARFRNGRTYAYLNVPAEKYEALLTEASRVGEDVSVGGLFNKLIRSAGYEYEEVEDG